MATPADNGFTPPLTKEEWDAVKAPFAFVPLSANKFHNQLIDKWCGINVTSSWWYRSEESGMVVFQSRAVAMAFKIWIETDPFSNPGEIDLIC